MPGQVHLGQLFGWLAVPHAVCEAAISSHADAAGLSAGQAYNTKGYSSTYLAM